jgi:hypothetical protein
LKRDTGGQWSELSSFVSSKPFRRTQCFTGHGQRVFAISACPGGIATKEYGSCRRADGHSENAISCPGGINTEKSEQTARKRPRCRRSWWQGQGGPSRRGEQGSKAEQRVSECKSRVCSLCTLIQIVANAHHQEGSERQRKVRAMREMSEGEGGNADVVAGFVFCSVRTRVHSCLQYGSKSSESETLPRGAGFKRAHSGTWGMRQGSADACGARQ